MKLLPLVLVFLVVIGTARVTAVGQSDGLAAVEDVEFISWVTGLQSPNQTGERYDVYGTDLGSVTELDDMTFLAFGDTFGCCPPRDGGPGGANWRSNVVAYATDRDMEDGVAFDGMIVDPEGHARAVLRSLKDDVTVIPTAGIGVNGRLYLHYMAVGDWGPPGEWMLNRSGWAYSDDRGQTWSQPSESVWQGDTQFGQAALVEQAGDVYVLGIHGGRFGGVALARVPSDDVLDMSAYRYWDGSGWAGDLDTAAVIVPAPVGELSVIWNEYLGRWIMTYLDEFKRAIVIRDAEDLTGPWGEPIEMVSADDYPSLYGAFLYPSASRGEVIYFNMSQFGPYNVLLMRARLVKATKVTMLIVRASGSKAHLFRRR